MSQGQKPEAGDSEVFEIERIRDLVELMKEHDLSEIDLRHAGKRIRVRRGNEPVFAQMPAMHASLPAPGMAAATPPDSDEAPADDNATFVNSPMVGTFYSSPKPDMPSFVKVGDHVDADTIVCLVEAMKMFNEIPAGVSGKIASVLVKNEEPVDVGKPLFKVIPD